MAPRPLLLLAGLGPGLGTSLAAHFAEHGWDIVGASRRAEALPAARDAVGLAGGSYRHVTCDLAEPAQAVAALTSWADQVAGLVYLAHDMVRAPLEATDEGVFERVWRSTCLGAFALSRLLLPRMAERGGGFCFYLGATASRRGGKDFAAFASAKFALRGLAQSLAREWGPRGVHVAHVVVDGLIDEPQSEARFGPARRQRMAPDAIAATLLALASQQRSAFTHELDLRPFSEPF